MQFDKDKEVEMARMFKALSHPARIWIVRQLAKSDHCVREFFAYEGCDEGIGYFISTYQSDGNPLPTFAGEPIRVSMPEPEAVWAALNADNKVSLYTKVDNEVKLFNKNLGD